MCRYWVKNLSKEGIIRQWLPKIRESRINYGARQSQSLEDLGKVTEEELYKQMISR